MSWDSEIIIHTGEWSIIPEEGLLFLTYHGELGTHLILYWNRLRPYSPLEAQAVKDDWQVDPKKQVIRQPINKKKWSAAPPCPPGPTPNKKLFQFMLIYLQKFRNLEYQVGSLKVEFHIFEVLHSKTFQRKSQKFLTDFSSWPLKYFKAWNTNLNNFSYFTFLQNFPVLWHSKTYLFSAHLVYAAVLSEKQAGTETFASSARTSQDAVWMS